MKCEYCDNPVPTGAIRCPSCGAAIKVINENLSLATVKEVVPQEVKQDHGLTSGPSYNPYLFLSRKSRIVYIVLALVFGEIGVHNFYAGFIGRGVAQLLITVLSFGLLFWVSWIWAVIEICAIDHDGRGVPFE